MPKAKWDQVFRIIAALRSYVITKAEMRQKGDGMDDEGTLKLQPSGRWAVVRSRRPPFEITSGNIFRVDVDGDLRLTRMTYRRLAGGGSEIIPSTATSSVTGCALPLGPEKRTGIYASSSTN